MSSHVTYDGLVCVIAGFVIGLCIGILMGGIHVH